MDLGAAVLPPIPKDTTGPQPYFSFAFTGNKFEFRSLGSAVNIACANVMLNTAVAEELRQFADELEGAEDFEAAVYALIKREIKAHKRIIFNRQRLRRVLGCRGGEARPAQLQERGRCIPALR